MAALLSWSSATASPESADPIGGQGPLPAAVLPPPPVPLRPVPEQATTDAGSAPPQAALVPAGSRVLRQVRDRAAEMVITALNFVGVRYRRGGDSESNGFDCSGFTRHVFGRLGIVLPRRVDEQASAAGLVAVAREDLQPGDLVFFNTLRRTFSHVGIYIGDNRFVHAPRPGGEVRTESMAFAYWAKRYTGARRVEPGAPADEQASVAAVATGASGE